MLKTIKRILESYLFVPVLFLIAYIGWAFGINYISLIILTVFFACILGFCEDVKNIFAIIFYIGFYIKDILEEFNTAIYITCAGVLIVSLILFFIKLLVEKKLKVNGKFLFLSFILLNIAFLTAGIIDNFKLISFFVVLALDVTSVLLYIIASSATKNLRFYLPYLFFVGGIYVLIEILTSNVINGENGIKDIFVCYRWLSAESVNTASIYLVLGIVGAFYLGENYKYEIITFPIASCFLFVTVITYCRTVVAIGFFVYIALLIYSFIKSESKIKYGIAVILVFAVAAIVMFLSGIFTKITDGFIKKIGTGLNGRSDLWKWYFGYFKDFPVFGVGYTIDTLAPSIREEVGYFVLAHNSIYQILVSCGIVGLVLAIPFYVSKYIVVIKNIFKDNIYIPFLILVIALSGMMDQAAMMEYYVYIIPIICLVALTKKEI